MSRPAPWWRRALTFAVPLLTLAPALALGGHGAGGIFFTHDPDYVKRLMDAGEPVVLVDLRPVTAYRTAHLPGARSLPLPEFERRLEEIPRAGRVILYGDSTREGEDAYVRLVARGYRNVAVLDDGFSGWTKRGFPVQPAR